MLCMSNKKIGPRRPTHELACTSFCLLFAVVNGTAPAFSVAVAAAAAAATANPPVLPPALPARDTNPWAKTPVGAPASAQPGKQHYREVRQVCMSRCTESESILASCS